MSADGSIARRPPTVPAQWALVSKRLDPSGTYAIDGYEVVGTSGNLALAQSLQETCLTGTPNSSAVGTPDALPWVIVTAGGAQGPVMAMTVVTSSPLRTEGGRAVTPNRILWTDWQDAAHHRMSWAAMAVAHRSLPWLDTVTPAQGAGEAVGVPAAEFAVASVAEDIDRFGFDWVAGLAGLVLEGRRIAIVAETGSLPGVDDRLKLFDAVCALLPYGYRARFSAATWAKANVEHGVLLVFSDAVAKDQHRVVWQAPLPRPGNTDAVDYVELLQRLRHGEARFGTADIVDYLLKEPDPRRCRDAEAARGILLRMDLAREVARLIRAGRGRVADVRRVLAEDPLDRLPSDTAQTFVQFLGDRAGQQDPAARDLLIQTWSAETELRLGAYGRTFLTVAGLPRLHSWIEVADRTGSAAGPALLREVLRPAERIPDLPPASADVAVQLLSKVKGAITDAEIQRVMAAQPTVCVALLAQILSRRQIPAERIVEQIDRWLRDPDAGGRPWLVPFGFAIGREAPTDEQWRALRDADDRVWLVLLRVAATGRQSERVFASMWPFLVERAGRETTPARDAAFDAGLRELTPARCGLPDSEWARIDVLHLIRFGAMPGLAAGAAPLHQYREVFQAAWYGPVLAGLRAGLNARLVRAVFPEPGTVAQADRLMAVVAPSDPQLMELAARSIAHEIDSRPVVFGPMNFSDEWIGQIRRFSAEDHFWIYQELRTLGRTNGTVERIAGCYLRGRQIGLTFADLDEIMGWWIGHQPPQSVKRLLIELWNYGDLDDAEKFRRRVAAGEYGDRQVAENWNTYTRRRHVFAEWLAGESKPPRRVAADSGSAGRFEVVTKKLAGTFRPSTRNSGDEHPAPDHG